MKIIGITGGVASGKSTVARMLENLGAGVLDADRAGHEALRLPPVEMAARKRWGDGISGDDGRIDRSKLARLVFAPEQTGQTERLYLEQLTHPEIARLLQRQADGMADRGIRFAVLDAPLLLEAGWDNLCEKTLFIETPPEVRLARAVDRGWNEDDFTARENAQKSLQQKRESADVIIDNSTSPERTQAQVERFWASLVR